MNDNLFVPRKKREPFELQLTAMIDVFSMIVIFLIFGTVFGAADMVIPNGVEIPKSFSKEGIDSAPRIVIQKQGVSFSMSDDHFAMNDFKVAENHDRVKQKLKPILEAFKKKQNETKATDVMPLNLVSDQATPYEDIYDVISVFRELGFNTIFFVASGGSAKK